MVAESHAHRLPEEGAGLPHPSHTVSSPSVCHPSLLLDSQSKMQHWQPGCEAFLMDLFWLFLPSFPPDVSFTSSCQLLAYFLFWSCDEAADPHCSSVISYIFCCHYFYFRIKAQPFDSVEAANIFAW